jgi:hypothetical protein
MRTITTNCLAGSVKKTNLKPYSFIAALCCMIALFFSTTTTAQTVAQSQLNCPDGHCTSKDLSIVDVFVDAPPCATCTGTTATYQLKMTIHNGTKSERTAFALYGTLSAGATINGISGNIFVCVGAITVKSDQDIGAGVGNQTFTVGSITFGCNQSLTLTNNYLAWTDASGTTADRCNTYASATKCADIEPKCGTAASITIRQPLSASYTTTQGCTGRSAGKIKVTPIGGLAPYSVVLKKGTVTVGTQSNVTASGFEFSGLAEGTDYSAVVTDATNPPVTHCTYTLTPMTLSSFFCCTAPTQGTNPSDVTKCAGESASFTATATGGDPAPTTQWQKKAPADAAFSNLTIAGVYSVSVNTLNISNTANLNGYQFRAVFTSAGCTPVNSNPATLTVNAIPGKPVVTYVPPTCTQTTFSVEIGSPSAGTYTLRQTSGGVGTVTKTYPADAVAGKIVFTGLTVGKGYRVTLTTSGCISDAETCGDFTGVTGAVTQKEIVTNVPVVESPTVNAYPNPFNDRIKFVVNSPNAGNGSLEVYNVMGQKVKTVYQGRINAGNQSFELTIPKKQQQTLFYMLRVDGKKVTGKLLQLNN